MRSIAWSRPFSSVTVVVMAAALLSGCTPNESPESADPSGAGASVAAHPERTSHACEDVDHQDMSVTFFPGPGQPLLDASVGRFTSPAGEPCLGLFVWDTDGWEFESYTLSASTWLVDVSMTGKDEDAYDTWLRIPTTTDCVPVHAEVILTKGDRTERYVRDFKAGACSPAVLRNVNKGYGR